LTDFDSIQGRVLPGDVAYRRRSGRRIESDCRGGLRVASVVFASCGDSALRHCSRPRSTGNAAAMVIDAAVNLFGQSLRSALPCYYWPPIRRPCGAARTRESTATTAWQSSRAAEDVDRHRGALPPLRKFWRRAIQPALPFGSTRRRRSCCASWAAPAHGTRQRNDSRWPPARRRGRIESTQIAPSLQSRPRSSRAAQRDLPADAAPPPAVRRSERLSRWEVFVAARGALASPQVAVNNEPEPGRQSRRCRGGRHWTTRRPPLRRSAARVATLLPESSPTSTPTRPARTHKSLRICARRHELLYPWLPRFRLRTRECALRPRQRQRRCLFFFSGKRRRLLQETPHVLHTVLYASRPRYLSRVPRASSALSLDSESSRTWEARHSNPSASDNRGAGFIAAVRIEPDPVPVSLRQQPTEYNGVVRIAVRSGLCCAPSFSGQSEREARKHL